MIATVENERDLQVLKTYKEFKKAMKKYGQVVSFTTKTDPRKTYSWRYVSNFIKKLDQSGLTENMPVVIEAVVENAHKRRTIHKGFAILNRGDILQIVQSKLEREERQERNEIELIEDSVNFVRSQVKDDILSAMLWRRVPRARTNLTTWFESGRISVGYIALSRVSRQAIAKLQGSEREIFPSWRNLMKIRLLLVHSQALPKLRELLGEDLFEE